ncbi:MAG: PilX N-terminal domain-containing pilus assembly protein [Syntrophobacterales bacterium]|jgi:hypothetical protein
MNAFSIIKNNQGSALVVALLMLVVLTLLGIAATSTSTVELQISGNDKLYKTSFYAADTATEMTGELLEQNIETRDWVNPQTEGSVAVWRITKESGGTIVEFADGNLFMNREDDKIPGYTTQDVPVIPSDSNYDAIFPLSAVDTSGDPWILDTSAPHTNIKVVGNTTLSTGSAVQLIAGYEGKGKGAAGGGAWITYDIRAERRNVRNTAVTVRLGWRHVL